MHLNGEGLAEEGQSIRFQSLNPRPAGPSPAATLCWGGGGGVAAPIYLGDQQTWGGGIQTAMERPGRNLSDKVLKFDFGVTCDVTGQVKHKMFDISI